MQFTRDAPTSTWRADLGALLQGKAGVFAVMVVPAAEGAPLYEVRLARPTLAAAPAPVAAATNGVADLPAATRPLVVPSPPVSFGAPGVAALAEETPVALPDVLPRPAPDVVALDPPAPGPVEAVTAGTPVTPVPATGDLLTAPPVPVRQDTSRAGRALSFTLVAAVVGLLGGITRRMSRGLRSEVGR